MPRKESVRGLCEAVSVTRTMGLGSGTGAAGEHRARQVHSRHAGVRGTAKTTVAQYRWVNLFKARLRHHAR